MDLHERPEGLLLIGGVVERNDERKSCTALCALSLHFVRLRASNVGAKHAERVELFSVKKELFSVKDSSVRPIYDEIGHMVFWQDYRMLVETQNGIFQPPAQAE